MKTELNKDINKSYAMIVETIFLNDFTDIIVRVHIQPHYLCFKFFVK